MAIVRGQWLNHFGKRLWKKIPTGSNEGMPGPKALCQQTVIARLSLRSLRLSQILNILMTKKGKERRTSHKKEN